jgi:transcriptional regulator with XRE-family HTH domain
MQSAPRSSALQSSAPQSPALSPAETPAPHSSPLHFPDPGAGSAISPAITLGEKLRLARLAAGYRSQDALAREMQVDRSLVNKAESGRRVPTDPMLRTWCQLCRLDYAPFAAQAHKARTWKNPVPPFFETFRDVVLVAHTVRAWQPMIVPGLLQTAEYAGELFGLMGESGRRAAELVAARIDLQRILDRENRATLWTVFDEFALHRQFGSPEIMYRQLMHLVEQGQRPHIGIQVVPVRYSGNAGHTGAFTIASVAGKPDVLLAGAVKDVTTDQPDDVRLAHAIFDRVRSVALPKSESLELIAKVAEGCTRKTSTGVSPATAATTARTA